MSTTLAPLALFVFRRPRHTQRVLDALRQCPELVETPLFIFADAARNAADQPAVDATRKLVRDLEHPCKHLRFAETNMGLAGSIIAGVNELCRDYGRVITLEDDLLVGPCFLTYMNQALVKYKYTEKVYAVNAFNFGDLNAVTAGNAFFLNYTHPWSWATWDRAWSKFQPDSNFLDGVTANRESTNRFNLEGADDYVLMLQRQQVGNLDSWWIRWYSHMFLHGVFGLFPPVPMVRSIGADSSATNMQFSEWLLQPTNRPLADKAPLLPDKVEIDARTYRAFRATMRPRLRRALRGVGTVKRLLLHA